MNAGEVRECLRMRWPDTEYLTIAEAPESADRQGRKIDLLVLSLWRSRGYEREAVEIKVSLSDWKRELDNAAKADFWWRHAHRFWLAVPVEIAEKVREDLPSGWGLLSCTPNGSFVVVKAEKHEPEVFTWQTTLGILRACANAGWGALQHAENKGFDRGREFAQREAEHKSGDQRLLERWTVLTEKVAAFEEAFGLDISSCYSGADAARLGRIAALVNKHGRDPQSLAEALEWQATQIESRAQILRATIDELRAL